MRGESRGSDAAGAGGECRGPADLFTGAVDLRASLSSSVDGLFIAIYFMVSHMPVQRAVENTEDDSGGRSPMVSKKTPLKCSKRMRRS
jgi:hypothetical protein